MIFDTDVLIWFFRGDHSAGRAVDSERSRRISIVSLMELLQGAKSKKEAAELRRFFRDNAIEVVPINEAIAYGALALMEEHAQADGLQVADALIAATALQLGETLATANVRHFRPLRGIRLKEFRRVSRNP